MNQIAGVHCIIELYECPFRLLDNENFIREMVSAAAVESGSTLLSISSHKFSPQGVTALGLLAESHISVHTWPETGYAAADVFTCGHHCDPKQAAFFLIKALQAKRHVYSVLQRGSRAFSNIVVFPSREKRTDEETCIRTKPSRPYG